MSYLVTHGNDPAPGPIAIDTCKDLQTALAHACYLISTGHPNVTIADGDGHQISGDELVECCNETKKLTSDLKAVPV
jgi:hypothetical protein